MILEMKVPSPGESITEVEIAQWLVAEGDYIQKDQAIAEVDSDKATLELPAETSGTISLKAEEGDAVAVGSVVCLIDTEGKPLGGESSSSAQVEKNPVVNTLPTPIVKSSYATGTASIAAKKIISEKGIDIDSLIGSGRDGRITKEDAQKAKASMGTPIKGGNRSSTSLKLSMLRRKVSERLVSVKNETAMSVSYTHLTLPTKRIV